MERLNIRMKLLIVFMLLFTAALAGSFYWFYQFATNKAMDDLRASLVTSARTAASMIDADAHTQVYAAGQEDTPAYIEIADKLRLVRDANPRAAAVYTAILSPNPAEVIFVVSADEDPETRAHLGEPYDASNAPEMILAFQQPIADVEMGADEFGVWLSGYAPIPGASGAQTAIVVVDMMADEVLAIQRQIRNTSILVFIAAYLSVLVAAMLLSNAITKPLNTVIRSAQTLEKGEPFQPEQLETVAGGADELAQLARVFSRMAVQVQAREQKLKEEVVQLRIEIDEVKRQKQVAEIVESDFFQDLQGKAREMRRRRSTDTTAGEPS
jgi:hypothetical protein